MVINKMASRFTRNIRDTRVDSTQWKQDEMEPLNTNEQNDLLSDGENVYVRNKKKYEPLTKGIINLESEDDHIISVERPDKNTAILKPNANIVTEIVSDNNTLLEVLQQGHKVTLKPKGGGGSVDLEINEDTDAGKVTIKYNGKTYELPTYLVTTVLNNAITSLEEKFALAVGDLKDLSTEDKTSIVNAINEIFKKPTGPMTPQLNDYVSIGTDGQPTNPTDPINLADYQTSDTEFQIPITLKYLAYSANTTNEGIVPPTNFNVWGVADGKTTNLFTIAKIDVTGVKNVDSNHKYGWYGAYNSLTITLRLDTDLLAGGKVTNGTFSVLHGGFINNATTDSFTRNYIFNYEPKA